MSKIKILYIGPVPPDVGGKDVGGIATHCWQLAIQAYKRGYEVYILTNTDSSPEKNGIKIINPPQKNKLIKTLYGLKFWRATNQNERNSIKFLSFKARARILYSAFLLEKVINSVKPELIHIHSLHDNHTLSLTLLQNIIPLVITDHGFWQRIHSDREIVKVRKTANKTDRIICVSNFSKKQIENYKLAPINKTKVIHNPIDIEKIPLLNRGKTKEKIGFRNKKIILFSGVVEPVKRKGLDILLKAIVLDSYLKEKCKIVIITKNEGLSYAHNFVKQNRIDSVILNPQPWAKIVNLYNAADVFVMPSRSESFGLVYGESLLAGTPIVGFHQILDELENILGLYIGEKFNASEETEKDLAEKIKKVLNTEFDREQLRRKIIEKFSWDVKFSEYESVYRDVCQRGLVKTQIK